jgi:molybdopterin converting factor small subunit
MDVRLPSKALRKTGLEVLGDQPWGTHYCLFFETKNDLLDILVPYFTTGLANNEFCFWVLADPLSEDEARYALRQAMRASDRHLIDRQMEFMSDAECYLSGGTFSLDRVSSEWGDRLSRSLSAGYEGIRVTGSTGWLHTREWTDFWKYEAALNESISDQPMTVLCTYSLLGSGGVDVLDVTSTHQSAVAKRGGKWEVIETAALKAAKEEVRRLNEELEQRVIERTQELAVAQAQLARVERVIDHPRDCPTSLRDGHQLQFVPALAGKHPAGSPRGARRSAGRGARRRPHQRGVPQHSPPDAEGGAARCSVGYH